MSYPCTACGLCCKKAGEWVTAARSIDNPTPPIQEIADFPHAISSNGTCSQLNPDNTCKIYANRPDICSVKKMWEKYHQNNITEQEYYVLAAATCNQMIEGAGLDERYLVEIK